MSFTAKDLVDIIGAIKGSGITSLEFEGLKISTVPETQISIQHGDRIPFNPPQEPIRDFPEEEHLRAVIDRDIGEDEDLKDLERQNLMIEDPVAFEEMMDREDQTDAEIEQRAEQPLPEGRQRPDYSLRRATN